MNPIAAPLKPPNKNPWKGLPPLNPAETAPPRLPAIAPDNTAAVVVEYIVAKN
jgi:hypothetical protein